MDGAGKHADPITIVARGKLEDIARALVADGWSQANAPGTANDLRYLRDATREELQRAALKAVKGLNRLLPHRAQIPTFDPHVRGVQAMPVTETFFEGQPMVAAYERNNQPLGGRDHLLIHRDPGSPDCFLISASKDNGLMLNPKRPQALFLDHQVVPDVGGERDEVIASFARAGSPVVEEHRQNFGTDSIWGEIVPDGKVVEIDVRPASLKQNR